MSEELSLNDFGGTARLFPLPNLVLFPHVIQPLHIFEPRYRQLLEDALAEDRLLAMALLQPGWEEDYHKQPPIHPVVCLGRIFQEERLTDGRYNLLLRGLCRARVLEEPPTTRLYRTARVELLSEGAVTSTEVERPLRERLRQASKSHFAGQSQSQLRQLLESQVPLGALCDIFAFALPLAPELKQLLLENTHSESRTRLLLSFLEAGDKPQPEQPATRPWPPEFSTN